MAGEDDGGTDGSSIKPVSSLRSRFENLGIQSSSTLRTPSTSNDSRAAGSARVSIDIPRPTNVFDSSSNALGISAPPLPNATKPRPLSPFASSRQSSPPRVTIDSPDLDPTPPRPIPGSRSPSRSPIPRGSLSQAQPWGAPTDSSSMFRSNLSPNLSTSTENLMGMSVSPKTTRGPPPVNRAAKPSIPSSLPGPTTPVIGHGRSQSRSNMPASPFATPPSSAETTPGDRQPFAGQFDRASRSSASTLEPKSYFLPLASPARSANRQPELPPRQNARVFSTPETTIFGRDASSRERSTSTIDGASDRLFGPKITPPAPNSRRTSPQRTQTLPSHRQTEDGFAVPELRVHHGDRPAATNGSSIAAARAIPEPVFAKPAPPAIPAPRRSVETRRSIDVRVSQDSRRSFDPLGSSVPTAAPIQMSPSASRANSIPNVHSLPNSSGFGEMPSTGTETGLSDFPDSSNANRKPPKYNRQRHEFGTGYDTRLMTACGEYVCTGGYLTRIWSIVTGESISSITHTEGTKVTAMAWKPMQDVKDEGCRLWLGTNLGDIMELDIPSRRIVSTKAGAHSRGEVVKIFRHGSDLWSLDDCGRINNWKPTSQDGVASLDANPYSHSIPRGQSVSIVVGKYLWMAHGKLIRVFDLTEKSDVGFNVLQRPLTQEGAGDVTSAAALSSQPNMVYFAHNDGKISVYNQKDFSLVGLFNVSVYKIHVITGVGNLLWAGYSTGAAFVYDTTTTPWTVRKTWRAHTEPVCSIVADPSSIWKMDRFNVVTLGMDNNIRVWDGMLESDWLEDRMQQRTEEYCNFNDVSVAVMTWNAGASKPSFMRSDSRDVNFFRDYITAASTPDIFIFGFQELVDLEDKKLTAKSFFKSSKKKDSTDNDKMSHQYRAWRDHLVRCLSEFMPASCSYALLQTADMVGLFSCVFVKTSLRSRIKQLDGTQVKRGMGGLHGNKGGIILRMILDDSSICLVNCHLAAGQTSTNNRNNDIAAIMEDDSLPRIGPEPDLTFINGGDGAMILDHEICILNGDLNYRIDAMTRDNVVRAVRDNNLAKLLDRDQLLLSRKRNPAFRLKLFQEMPITFAPTYKYNVGTDDYDTSEKKRSPAWCDRILFRGAGRVQCSDYRRWEVHASDHRPVSARLNVRVKRIDGAKREKVLARTMAEYDVFRREVKNRVKLDYLVNVLGISQKEANKLLSR